jgi:hypothetical protein
MTYLPSLECLCVKAAQGSIIASTSIEGAKLNCRAAIKANIEVIGSIASSSETAPKITRVRTSSAELVGMFSVETKLSANLASSSSELVCEGEIKPKSNANYTLRQAVNVESEINVSAEKFAGNFVNFECTQKLYPIRDIATTGIGQFLNENLSLTDLYNSIDEGVFTGNYHTHGKISTLIADDFNTYIQPSAVHSEGLFQYKCEVTKPIARPEDSRFRIRASAPLSNYESRIPPKYTIHEIQFLDPSGTLIIEYDDICVRGDSNYNINSNIYYNVYSSKPKKNNVSELYEWQEGFPLIHESSGYTLSFKISVETYDDAFDKGFDVGFEENATIYNSNAGENDYLSPDGSPLSTQNQSLINPTHGIRISAIEICNSGGIGPRPENYINLYAPVRDRGHRIQRVIYPSLVKMYNFDTGIWPSVETVWENELSQANTSDNYGKLITESIINERPEHYITLTSSTIQDSGKLCLKFGHTASDFYHQVTDGAFAFGFDESIYNKWTEPFGAFNTQNKTAMSSVDSFFVVESVSLRVLAKKQIGSRNYNLDVVGYSDDKILCVTSAVGGFLQNTSGVGVNPVSSGFNNPYDFSLGGTASSEKDGYYETSGNLGGDHYSLAITPTVTGTEFAWYEVPLKIYEDKVTLGKSRNYNISSLFEKLYLDIYPIPSGASVASVQLLVNYAPQNALNLITEGGEKIRKVNGDRSEIKFYPIPRGENDLITNAGPDYAPLSTIENIPHAYTTPTTIKSNYSRRWRGMEGTVQGPFDPDMFGFGYENPLLDFPFLSGFYDFDYDQGTSIVPRVGSLTGTLNTTYSDYRFKNLGWRFQDNTLFTDKLPGYTGVYQTTDWTSLDNGVNDFTSHPLYGKIADAFNNAVRISGHNSYIDFGDVDIADEFSLYIRFTPDSDVSGVGRDLFESGVLVSKWETGNDLEFALGYASGYLRATARDAGGSIHIVQDGTHYTEYQYPLSIILTYNDHYSSGLKLYTDNELENNWTTLRASSVADFDLATGSSKLIVGNSTGSGVGFNMFVSEFGLSNKANIVYSNPDLTFKEVTAQTFLENNRVKWWANSDTYSDDSYKLWNNVNEDTYSDWTIGDFKYCSFGPAFSRLTKRTGRNLISFNIVHNGSGYIQNADLAMPTNVDSGVAYHTQIENDFLRFGLSDTADNFYSILKRVSKDLPRGYKFAERALVVETIIEHETNSEIIWNDGNIGPKFIVSLYTRNKEPYWTPDEPNWGLVNRKIHYIEPSSCMMKLSSTFDYDSLIDESEKWALFPNEPRLREFKETYFSDDIDDMFVQYDLVYPSGPAFESRINIHSLHVRAENAYILASGFDNSVNLVSSGGYPESASLNLVTDAILGTESGVLYLYAAGRDPIPESGILNITTSGGYPVQENLALILSAGAIHESGFNLYTEGEIFNWIGVSGQGLNLTTLGKGIITSVNGDYYGLSLTALNTDTSNIPDGQTLNLFSFAGSGADVIRTNLPIYLAQNHQGDPGYSSGVMNLATLGSSALFSRYPNGSMNLHIFSNKPTGSLNLTLYGDNYSTYTSSGSLNLTTANYIGFGSTYTRWFNENYGVDIDIEDNSLADVPVGDEIRGVDLIGYGSCGSDSSRKAIDPAVVTHDTIWRPETCNDGGIFRAVNTYTNIEAGYSGNFYGIRKYENLVPNAAYNVELKITTGSTESIKLPNEWEEWEYGTNDSVNYSGIKLIGDYPLVVGDDEIATISGRMPNDNYGKKVVVKGDILAIGSPFHQIPDESGYMINNAGSIFVYRRSEDVAGQKADWSFEQQLMLPSGYRRDYISETIENFVCYPNNTNPEFCVSGQLWNIGQQGREFGHSVDVASSGSTETIVVGAPGANWNRTFNNIVTSGIPVCMMVFTDVFEYDKNKIASVGNAANKYDILYKYFSAPWNAGGDEFQPQIDIKLLICQVRKSTQDRPPVNIQEDWVYHTYLDRLDDLKYSGSGQYLFNSMTSGVHDIFFKAFPHNSELHSGVPPVLAIFEDNSPSTSYGSATQSVVDSFVNFYKNYSFVSGVVDPNGMIPSSGYVNSVRGISQDWEQDSIDLLDNTLSTGNLIANDALKYITSGIGQEWANGNAYEFQIPPASGGRVYIFEKENDVFNLVQEIRSPLEDVQTNTEYNNYYRNNINDRFGHSVSISNNSEVIVIGSPYATETVQVYEKDATEQSRMYAGLAGWLTFRGKTLASNRLTALTAASGATVAKQIVYNELNSSDKFAFRSDRQYWNNDIITPFKKIYTYSPSLIGTWTFIPGEFAGTSRLGYSTAIADDGNKIAVGAPTDSFNEFDDSNVWYKNENTWASYTNAGAVRIFESRKYYPHNLAVEFYRFGNLDRNVHKNEREAGYYDQMGLYLQPANIPFRRTDFSEIEIPQEAGLAFIITPELDAASDEIIQNIKDWLALGNRTLVLVGNDPVYEENGLYKDSNKIINKILDKLGSRMRIVPARNQYESLPECADVTNEKFNVTNAFVPQYAHSTSISAPRMYARGVGDIKIYLEKDNLQNLLMPSPCDDLNSRCEMPLMHYGDLRAKWESECIKTVGNQSIKIKYQTNWPFHFGNENPAQSCDDYPESPNPIINRPNQDPRPILTAAEWIPQKDIIIPAKSGVNVAYEDIYETITTNSIYYDFSDSQINNLEFVIREDENSNVSGNFVSFDQGMFFNPDKYGDRNAFLQATGTDYFLEPKNDSRILSQYSVLAAEENYVHEGVETTSKAILVASLFPESDDAIGSLNDDQNIPFYWNIARETCGNNGKIKQISGFTGRSSFKDAYSNSDLEYTLSLGGNSVTLNVDLTTDSLSNYNDSLIWIAKPQNTISDEELDKIKNWLATGDKKIVITYNGSQSIARNVADLCEKLGLQNTPYFSNEENLYIHQTFGDNTVGILAGDNQWPYNENTTPIQKVNKNSDIIKGCSFPHDTKIDKVLVKPVYAYTGSQEEQEDGYWIPISVTSIDNAIIYYEQNITENFKVPVLAWKLDAKSEITFNVIEGSGYRIFVDWVSETPQEGASKQGDGIYIDTRFTGVSFNPDPSSAYAYGQQFSNNGKLSRTSAGNPEQKYFDVRIPSGVTEITVTFDTTQHNKIMPDEVDGQPITPRILSVSGCLLPIESRVSTSTYQRKIGEKRSETPWYEPQQIISLPEEFRPIKTDNTKYCLSEGCEDGGNQLIEDGPVIAAEEFENFSSFVNGSERSRIVVISDSTLLQGQCPDYRNDALAHNQAFIRSLYPAQPNRRLGSFDYLNSESFGTNTRQFKFTQKIVSPERGSAAKFYAASGLDGSVSRYGLGGVNGNLSNYTDQENSYDPAIVSRPSNPKTGEEIKAEIKIFGEYIIPSFGVYPRYSGMIDGTLYVDAGVGGGVPDILRLTGKDHIDFDAYPSGFAGDLFGYSVSMHENKLVIGSPFNAYIEDNIVAWDGVQTSGANSTMKLSNNGGAGAVFYYERTEQGKNAVSETLPWQFKQKIKPSSINIGIDNCTIEQLEQERNNGLPINLDANFVINNAMFTDQFGYDVSVDADMLAVGAPCHDFENVHEHIYDSGQFIRKEFNAAFDIPTHKVYDLGSSGVRIDQFDSASGTMVLNNGAVFTFLHKMTDWENRAKKWVYAEKLVSQGYNSREQYSIVNSGCENDLFGRSVSLYRARRGDGDYTLAVGAPKHDFATSGDHFSVQPMFEAGAAYTYDAMLREQVPAIPSDQTYITASVFGHKNTDIEKRIHLSVTQNKFGNSITYSTSGVVFANENGDIFLEASGFDPATQGFVAHRPYVESVIGQALDGTLVKDYLNLIASGKSVENSGKMNLNILGADSANVYNTMNMLVDGAFLTSGTLNLATNGSDWTESSGNLNLFMSGITVTNNQLTPLNMRIRGK